MARRFLGFSLLLTMLAGCAPSTRIPEISDDDARAEARLQQDFALRAYAAKIERLDRVAWALTSANQIFCGDRLGGRAGMLLGSQLTLGRDFEAAPRRLWGVGEAIAVLDVIPGGPADRAGLRRGDEILAINDHVAPGLGQDRRRPTKTIEMQWLADVADRQFSPGAKVDITFRRDGDEDTVPLTPEPGCLVDVRLEGQDQINALADGRTVHIFSGLMNFVQNDDELAFVIGHEMAHVLMDHGAKQGGNAALGQVVDAALSTVLGRRTAAGRAAAIGMYAQAFEAEADYMGAYLAVRSGFDAEQGAHFLRRMAAEHPEAIHLAGSDHPSTAKRFLAIRRTLAEIDAKRNAGQSLEPTPTSEPMRK